MIKEDFMQLKIGDRLKIESNLISAELTVLGIFKNRYFVWEWSNIKNNHENSNIKDGLVSLFDLERLGIKTIMEDFTKI